MDRIANPIVVLWGWRRVAIAIGAGALSALAMAPFNLFPLLWLTVPVFVWLIDGATPAEGAGFLRRLLPAAVVGWSFGFGYFLGGLWWIGTAFLVEAEDFAWALPFAVTLLPAGLALFWALGTAVARSVWCEGWPRILVFAVAMAGAEWLRGHVLTGFPWNAFGYALMPGALTMQSASLVGLWGVTLAAFIIFAAPAALAGGVRGERRGQYAIVAFAFVLFVAHVGFGGVRLLAAGDPADSGITVRIVQPVLRQEEKWNVANEDAIVDRYLSLSDGATSPDRNGVGGVDILVWPESAFPFLLTERPEVLSAIADLLPSGTALITGAARAETGRVASDQLPRVFNSIYVIADDGEIVAAYDKVHLVPFGEFLPFPGLLERIGLTQLVALPSGFSPGARHLTLALENAPSFSPLICYEIVFPGEAVAPGPRPGWILNLTNDGWFGDTPGPHQHFQQARVRAVEEGLPLVRGANSGISAVVDGYGRVRQSLGVGLAGIVDGSLPPALTPTPYADYGDWVFLFMLMVAGCVAAYAQFPSRLNGN
ncbi:MAG: apolipoprotein N-acyltransferase [Bauldia sp.]|uniref:apolipoprotein N-acyltransferase n=1 Tax=Bauldia sp. TaxID=2575872 RepID=UPI001D370231|nr:apolipoprotein N-acyltransferase [Bauldia sp.]MCB1497537.1 apolipoprotein N-acyltransferase [Bauldia sp.]